MNRERLEIGGATSRLGNRSHYEIGDPMQPANLESEFDLAYRNRTQEHRQHLADAEITFQAMLRAGDLGVERINASGRLYMPSSEGFPAVILAIWSPAPPSIYCAVDDPEIIDLIAFRTDDPGRWWYRLGEPGLILGEDRYLDAIDRDTKPRDHGRAPKTP